WLIRPCLSLPPLEFCSGTSPEKSRPDRKALASATLATSAVASAGPGSEPSVPATDCREPQATRPAFRLIRTAIADPDVVFSPPAAWRKQASAQVPICVKHGSAFGMDPR